ncbi:MAG: HAD family hydrolase [Eubacteriales bacterium]|nr:HAD family hydrolase [Eubacteriales bacterium]
MPRAALIYDFDHTLTPRNMQEFGLLEELRAEPDDFWAECRRFALRHNADGILSYMMVTLSRARRLGIELRREDFVRLGGTIEFYPGVEEWFAKANAFAKGLGLELEHYIISSGLLELIEGSRIAGEFKAAFAASYAYDEQGLPFWPATAVNYTAKTQYLFRINKGILDITNDRDLNDFTPEARRRVPFRNMIYIGDGYTDVPCMKMTKQKGGTSIAVYEPENAEVARSLLRQRRAHYALEADYREGSDLWHVVCGILDDIAQREREMA